MGTPAQWYDTPQAAPDSGATALENQNASNRGYLDYLVQRAQQQSQPQFSLQQPQQNPLEQAQPSQSLPLTAATPGPVKQGLRHALASILGGIAYGAGQTMVHAAGGETDADKAMRIAMQNKMASETNEGNARAQLLGVQTQIEQRKQQMFSQFFSGQGMNDPAANLGDLAPHEKAILDAARTESAIKGDLTPYFMAVKDIGDTREQHQGVQLGDVSRNQLNAALTRRYQVLNPGQPLPDEYTLPANATDKDYARISGALDDQEKALGLKQTHDFQQNFRQDQANFQNQARNDARADRNYTFNSNHLDTIAKPIEDSLSRMSRLDETLRQNSPQADSLVAPELLTIMAGGQGSGLRMNEAEISRIVGGRSNWQNLQAWAQKWSTDPAHANSLTPSQRSQVQNLVGAVEAKAQAKRGIIEDARQSLINADDPIAQRQIIANTHTKLNAIDSGALNPSFAGATSNSGSDWKSRSIPVS